jgi:hypothetical protein
MPWRERFGSARGARRMKSPNDASTTKPATGPPTKAENERQGSELAPNETSSAVIFV